MGEIKIDMKVNNQQAIQKVKETQKQIEDAAKRIEKSGDSVDGFFDKMKTGAGGGIKEMLKFSAAMAGVTSASAMLMGAIKGNIETAKEFEKSISQLRSLTGLFGEDLEYLKNEAMRLGSTTTQTASQVVEAMKLIGSQKPELLKNKEALAEVTAQAITLAEAAVMDVPAAASALTGALNQMGATAKDAGEYINIMAAASQQGAGDINYINGAIVKSGATAKMAGLSFSELTAAIEAVATGGYDASTSGTSLRNIFLRLEKQTKAKFKPSVVGLSKALENLGAAHLSAEKKASLFGAQNIAVANTLIEQRGEFNKLSESIKGTNTAYDQAKINTDNFAGSVESLKSAWEGLMLTINDSNGPLRSIVETLKNAVENMRLLAMGDEGRIKLKAQQMLNDDAGTGAKLRGAGGLKARLSQRMNEQTTAFGQTREQAQADAQRELNQWFYATRSINRDDKENVAAITQAYKEASEYIKGYFAEIDKEKAEAANTKALGNTTDDPTQLELTTQQIIQAKKDAQALLDLVKTQGDEEAKLRATMRNKISQAEIDAMKDGREKVLAQADFDFVSQLAAVTEQEQQLLQSREEAARKLWEAKNAASVRNGSTWSNSGAQADFQAGNQLTDEDRAYFAALRNAAVTAHEQAVQKQSEADEAAMNDYLAKYGSMEERRAAINEQYQRKILAAATEGEAKALAEELAAALSNLDTEALKRDINWEMLFGDLGKYTKSQLVALRAQLKTYKQSDKYVKATEENKKVVDQALNSLTDTILSKGGIFGNIGAALQELADAEKELADAQEALDNAATGKEREAAQQRVNNAQNNKTNAQANVRTKAEETRDKVASLAGAITSLGTASEITLSDLGSFGQQIAGMFGEMGEKIGGWIGAIFTLCDMVARDGLEGLVKNVGKLLGQVVGGIFGFDIDKTTHYYEEQKKLHDNYIELIRGVIQEQEKLLKEQSGMDALSTYNKTTGYYRSIIDTTKSDIGNYLKAGASKGFLGIGSSAANGRNLYDKLFGKWLLEAMGISYGNDLNLAKQYADIFGLSGPEAIDGKLSELSNATIEQIKKLKENYELWTKLPDEVIAYYNAILEADEAMQDLKDTLSETITGTSFDTLESQFASTLESMSSDAQDFADDVEGYFNKAIINGLMKEKYSKMLKEWYGSAEDGTGFAGALASGVDKLTQQQIDGLREGYMGIVNDASTEADIIRQLLGIDTSSSNGATASINAVKSVSQDTANDIVGRMTAIQITNENVAASIQAAVAQFEAMGVLSTQGNNTLAEVRNLMITNNSYLEDIARYAKSSYIVLDEKLTRIANNTDKL